MLFLLVTAQHIAHEYFIKSTYLLHIKSNLVFLAFREVLVLTYCAQLYTAEVLAAILHQYILRNRKLLGFNKYVEMFQYEDFSQWSNQTEDIM